MPHENAVEGPFSCQTSETDRRRNVVEVELAAFVVCDGLGIETGNYSFAYVAGWSGGDVQRIQATAERVIACARQILGDVRAMTPTSCLLERERGHRS